MIHSEIHKNIFRMNQTYHNCLPESSHVENPSVLIGWWPGIGMASTLCMHVSKSFSE